MEAVIIHLTSLDVCLLQYQNMSDKKVYVEMVREIVESAISKCLDEKKAWLEAALEEGVEIMNRGNQYCVYLLTRNDAVFSK